MNTLSLRAASSGLWWPGPAAGRPVAALAAAASAICLSRASWRGLRSGGGGRGRGSGSALEAEACRGWWWWCFLWALGEAAGLVWVWEEAVEWERRAAVRGSVRWEGEGAVVEEAVEGERGTS